MTLQSSGAISISQIKTELGSSSNSLRDLSSAAGFSTPDAMSEFYGYSSYTPPPTVYFDSYFSASAYGEDPSNSTKNVAIFFGNWYVHPEFIVFPWRGAQWYFDISEIETIYGQTRDIPEEGSLDFGFSAIFSTDKTGHYLEMTAGNPSAFYYNWYDTYADPGMVSYSLNITSVYAYGVPSDAANEQCRLISYYT